MKIRTPAILLAVIMTLFAYDAQAQRDTTVRKPARAEVKQVQPRRVDVGSRTTDIPVIVATNKARKAPNWAGQSVAPSGGAMGGAATTLAAQPKSELKNVTLSVRNIYTPHANLMFRLATVNSDENYAFWNGTIQNVAFGYVSAGLHVEAGERYLLDFKINAMEPTTFGINVGDTKQDITVNGGEHHLLAYLDATETARVVALLNSDSANYIFYSLKVTRVN